jgi:hypothetical protein
MKLFLPLCILALLSCSQMSKEAMQKEYDSILRLQQANQNWVKLDSMIVERARDGEEVVYYNKQLDSLKRDVIRLEKRRQELAEKLYK